MRFEQVVAAVPDKDPVEPLHPGGRLRLLLERGADVEIAAQQEHRNAGDDLAAEAVA